MEIEETLEVTLHGESGITTVTGALEPRHRSSMRRFDHEIWDIAGDRLECNREDRVKNMKAGEPTSFIMIGRDKYWVRFGGRYAEIQEDIRAKREMQEREEDFNLLMKRVVMIGMGVAMLLAVCTIVFDSMGLTNWAVGSFWTGLLSMFLSGAIPICCYAARAVRDAWHGEKVC